MTEPIIRYDSKEEKFWIQNGDEAMLFDSLIDANDALRRIRVENAVKAEVAQITTWLRSLGNDTNHFLPATLAGWIEEGMHKL